MKKALIVYQSKTGTTKKYGFAIHDYIATHNIEVKAIPVQNFTEEDILLADYIFLGCWTSGLFVIMQHPDKVWSEFALKLPELKNKKVVLFTTYKLLTGSMFSKMEQKLKGKVNGDILRLKSRNILLSEKDKQKINEQILNN